LSAQTQTLAEEAKEVLQDKTTSDTQTNSTHLFTDRMTNPDTTNRHDLILDGTQTIHLLSQTVFMAMGFSSRDKQKQDRVDGNEVELRHFVVDSRVPLITWQTFVQNNIKI
jgi:hypothetical protein